MFLMLKIEIFHDNKLLSKKFKTEHNMFQDIFTQNVQNQFTIQSYFERSRFFRSPVSKFCPKNEWIFVVFLCIRKEISHWW